MARELGARKVHFAPLGTNGTYETPIALKWCTSLETENQYSEYTYSGDCAIESTGKKIDSINVKLGLSSSLPNRILAQLCGYEYDETSCAMTVATDAIALEGALLYEILMSDNTTKRKVLYNTSLYNNASSNETDSNGEDAIYEFEGAAIPVEFGGKEYLRKEIASADIAEIEDKEAKKLAEEAYNAFFSEVLLP